MSAAGRSPEELWVCDLGTVAYGDALALQEAVRARRQDGALPDVLLLLEHPPVYTLGRRTAEGELPFSEEFYRARGIEVHRCDRGGRITYHGPGQLVGYPIVEIQDVVAYVRALEASIVGALAQVGVEAHTRAQDGPDYTGVWVAERKIASIGVHVQRGVTTHGFALNVSNDLEPFQWVVACGLPDVEMTSLERELERAGAKACEVRFGELLVESFCEVFERVPMRVAAERLRSSRDRRPVAEVLA
jgi:lipoyl(octanoyl) transferase